MKQSARYLSRDDLLAEDLRPISSYPRSALVWALLCTVLAFSWQALKVETEFHGNWTGLFDTGRDFPPPPELPFEHIVTVSETTGYDGQFYHYVAHDPFFQHGLARYIDNPRLRYGRILVPFCAYALAAGNPYWIDLSYRFTVLAFVFLGAYWTARLMLQKGRRPDSALLFLLLPATILSIEVLAVDVALMALCAAFFLVRDEPSWKLLPVLALAPLVRETGLLLPAAALLAAVIKKNWLRAALFAVAVTPWLAWTWFVALHTQAQPYPITLMPLWETLKALVHVHNGSAGVFGWVLSIVDRLTIVGSIVAIMLGLGQVRRVGAVALACVGFALVGVALQRGDVWENYHAHTRLLSPLYMWLAMGVTERSSRVGVLPLYLVLPRFLFQILSQIPAFFQWSASLVRQGVKALETVKKF